MNRTRLSMKEWGVLRRKTYVGPMVSTDIIIEYDHPERGEGIILIERAFEPLGIALPGGFNERLSPEENARKEAKEETGLDVRLYTPRQPLSVFGDVNRDPREHVLAIAYVGRGTGVLHEGDDAKAVAHYRLSELARIPREKFAFPDHKDAIDLYLRERSRSKRYA